MPVGGSAVCTLCFVSINPSFLPSFLARVLLATLDLRSSPSVPTRRTSTPAAHGAARLEAASGSSGRFWQCPRRDACAPTSSSPCSFHAPCRVLLGAVGGGA